MSIESIGNPPPAADELRAEIEKQLPDIIASFNQVLQEQFSFEGIRVGGFSVVPAENATDAIACDEESCSIT
ncbi:hypothetical protein IQ241_01655 [Romeria aff. gracilis LEGE 07310]|uniref:Uncharacterized protein n=1 Tax=Vasconcelosia minhoensis LEGE 07310 TaxID=915328 RepID=A0A8J7DM67_9CYAN|nr:hypothetical protein [Romeria gracilis]MBE9076010.1 hypothetical protein [Romeria aff. gracilis LEGE 07310]